MSKSNGLVKVIISMLVCAFMIMPLVIGVILATALHESLFCLMVMGCIFTNPIGLYILMELKIISNGNDFDTEYLEDIADKLIETKYLKDTRELCDDELETLSEIISKKTKSKWKLVQHINNEDNDMWCELDLQESSRNEASTSRWVYKDDGIKK